VACGGTTVDWLLGTEPGAIPISADEGIETLVILAHGAGSHRDHRTVLWLANLVRQAGAGVARFDFAYRVLGRSMPDRMPKLMETYRAVIGSIGGRLAPKRLIIGGHSMGGRVASMIASEDAANGTQSSARGLLLFGYPLHPPGQFEKLRDAHLPGIRCPVLQISGTRDDFCRRDLMEAVPVGENYKVAWIDGADHSYSVAKASGRTKQDAESEISESLAGWLARVTPP